MPPSHAPQPKIRIREMSIDDVHQVYHLGEEVFTARRFPILNRTWDPYEVAFLFVSESELSIVAAQGKAVVGFCLATTAEKPGKPHPHGYLIWLGVSPAVQGRGVGKRLVAEALRRMKEMGVKDVLLDTEVRDGGAAEFFRHLGFRTVRQQVWLEGRIGARGLRRAPEDKSLSAPASRRTPQYRNKGRKRSAP